MITFNISIETIYSGYSNEKSSKVLEVRKFNTKEEAKKEVRKMIKFEGFERHGYNIWNPKKHTELNLNF